MSSRRQRRIQRSPPAATIVSADELVSRLRALLPPGPATAAAASSTAAVLEETCAYIRRLHAEVDGLADRLAKLLAAAAEDSPAAGGDAAAQLIIRALLM
ncbi:unnamed protein product [Urochloa humidicola]